MGVVEPDRSRHSRIRRYVVAGVLTVALVAVVFGAVFPRLADMREVWHLLAHLSLGAWGPVLVAMFVNMLANAPTLQAVAPGLGIGQAFVISQVSQSIANSLPAGEPVAATAKFALLRDAGIDGERAAGAVTADAMWVAVFRIGLPVAAVLWGVATGDRGITWFIGAALATMVLVAALALLRAVITSEHIAERCGRTIGSAVAHVKRYRGLERERAQERWIVSMHTFRAHTRSVVTRRWCYSVVSMTVQQLALFMAFLLSLRAVGIDADIVSAGLAFTAFTVGRLLAMAAQVPAGIGVLDLGFVGILASGSTASNESLVAAVLLFRFASWVPASTVGVMCLAGLAISHRRRNRATDRETWRVP